MSSFTKKVVRNSLIGLTAFILANRSVYTLDQTEQGVVTTFSKPTTVLLNPLGSKSERDSTVKDVSAEIIAYAKKEGISAPSIDGSGAGLKFKWPWQSVQYFDRRILEWDGAPEQVPTKDKKYLYVDGTARWYVRNPLIFLSALSGLESRGHGKLDDVVDGAIREQISKRDAIESIRSTNRKMLVSDKELEETVKVDSIYDGRGKIVHMINEQVNVKTPEYGIKEVDFMIKRLVYTDDVKKEVETRMISERKRISEKYISEGDGAYAKIMGDKDRKLNEINSGAYAKAEQIKGDGDAQATKIYNESFRIDPDFYSFYKSIDLMKNNMNGTTLIIDKNNQLFKYINGSQK